ncbi:MAG: hypothetical protein ACFCUE_08430 [Candidatus Bathyarchaeia archaeon]
MLSRLSCGGLLWLRKSKADLPDNLQSTVHFVTDQKDVVIDGTVTNVSAGAG